MQVLQNAKAKASGLWAKAAVGTMLAVGTAVAMAQEAGDGPIDTLFDSVDFSGIAAKVVAMGVIIVGIVVAFKGVDLVKRVIRKV